MAKKRNTRPPRRDHMEMNSFAVNYNLPKRFKDFYMQEMSDYKQYLQITEKYNTLQDAKRGILRSYSLEKTITEEQKNVLLALSERLFEKFSHNGENIGWEEEEFYLQVRKDALITALEKINEEMNDQGMTILDYVVSALQPRITVTPPSSARKKQPIMQDYLEALQNQNIQQQSAPEFRKEQQLIKSRAEIVLNPTPDKSTNLEKLRLNLYIIQDLVDKLTANFMKNGMGLKGSNSSVPPRALAEEIVLSGYSDDLKIRYSLFAKSLALYKEAIKSASVGKFSRKEYESYRLNLINNAYDNLINAYNINFRPEMKNAYSNHSRWSDEDLHQLLNDEFNILKPQLALLQMKASEHCVHKLEEFRDKVLETKRNKGGFQLSSFFMPGRLVNRAKKAEHTIELFNETINAIRGESNPKILANNLIMLQRKNEFSADYEDISKSANHFLKSFINETIALMEKDKLLPVRSVIDYDVNMREGIQRQAEIARRELPSDANARNWWGQNYSGGQQEQSSDPDPSHPRNKR